MGFWDNGRVPIIADLYEQSGVVSLRNHLFSVIGLPVKIYFKEERKPAPGSRPYLVIEQHSGDVNGSAEIEIRSYDSFGSLIEAQTFHWEPNSWDSRVGFNALITDLVKRAVARRELSPALLERVNKAEAAISRMLAAALRAVEDERAAAATFASGEDSVAAARVDAAENVARAVQEAVNKEVEK